MKKMKLSLDDLKVESFQTAAAVGNRSGGTVHAYASQWQEPSCDLTCASCVPSCQPTCGIIPGGGDPAKPDPLCV